MLHANSTCISYFDEFQGTHNQGVSECVSERERDPESKNMYDWFAIASLCVRILNQPIA